MSTLNDQTINKLDTIKNAGYKLVSTYECQLAKNKDLLKFSKSFDQEVVEPLSPRDPFYLVARQMPSCKLVYNFKENECGSYINFCLLYHTVQYYQNYSIGHPNKIFSP